MEGNDEGDEQARTIFIGGLHENVTESLLYELFLQGGPIVRVNIPKDKDGRPRNFGFVEYVHKVTVPYALALFSGTSLFNRRLNIRNTQSKSNTMTASNPQQVSRPNNQYGGTDALRQGGGFGTRYTNDNMTPINSMPQQIGNFNMDPALFLQISANMHANLMNPMGLLNMPYPSMNSSTNGSSQNTNQLKMNNRNNSDHRNQHNKHHHNDEPYNKNQRDHRHDRYRERDRKQERQRNLNSDRGGNNRSHNRNRR